MRYRSPGLLIGLAAMLVVACSGPAERLPVHELAGSAMGTTFSIKIVAPPENLDRAALASRVEETLERIEDRMSTWRAESELSRFNAHRGIDWFPVSAELCQVVAEALTLSAATGGAFDVTVGPLVNLWGFGPDVVIDGPPGAEQIDVLLASTGSHALHADCAANALRKDLPDLYVDLSAFAKGYGVDVVAGLLDEVGAERYLVEIGGEMRVRGENASSEPWAVAIEAPLPAERSVHAIIRVSDAAVATSGDYRNFFEHDGSVYSHTIDPRTGYPIRHAAASVTIVSDTAAFADAMATAVLVLGPDDGLAFAEREQLAAYILLREDRGIAERASSRFTAKVTYQ